MAKMCLMKGCKESHGMCKHEKMMLGILAAVIIIWGYIALT